MDSLSQLALEAADASLGQDHCLAEQNLARIQSSLNVSSHKFEEFKKTGNGKHLAEAVDTHRQALYSYKACESPDEKKLATMLDNLGLLFVNQIDFEQRHNPGHLLSLLRTASSEVPISSPSGSVINSTFSAELCRAYGSDGKENHLSEALGVSEKLLDSIRHNRSPANEPISLAHALNCLRNVLNARYGRYEKLEDLDRQISVMKEIISLQDPKFPAPEQECFLAQQLTERYKRHGGNKKDLDLAIELCKSFRKIPQQNSNRLKGLEVLIVAYCVRYDLTQSESDYATAMDFVRVEESETGTRILDRLPNLHLLFVRQLKATSDADGLRKSILALGGMLQELGGDDKNRAALLHNLGHCMGTLFELQGGSYPELLDTAIDRFREAVSVGSTKESPRTVAGYESGLASALTQRYALRRNQGDLQEAIGLNRDALRHAAGDSVSYWGYLMNLGKDLLALWDSTKESSALDEAITVTERALKLAPPARRTGCMSNLCGYLNFRHSVTSPRDDSLDLNQAIEYGSGAVRATSLNDPGMVAALACLIDALKSKYRVYRDQSIHQQVVSALNRMIEFQPSPPIRRLGGCLKGMVWFEEIEDWENLCHFTELAVNLLTQISPQSLRQADRQGLVRTYNGLASKAAAASLQAGRPPEHALEVLERGRGVLTSLTLQSRQDLSLLRAAHQDWAAEFEKLRDALETPVSLESDIFGILQSEHGTARMSPEEYRQTQKEYEEVLQRIRGDERFKSFLQPPSVSDLMSAVRRGETAVILNSEFRSDAILVHHDRVEAVEIPGLTEGSELWERVNHPKLDGTMSPVLLIMEALWDALKPILSKIGADKDRTRQPYNEWPRVFWVPMGALRAWPIHGAGYHDRLGRSLLDSVIFSYCISVADIFYSRQVQEGILRRSQDAKSRGQEQSPKLVLVSMESTPGHARLPSAAKEVREIHKMISETEGGRSEVMENPQVGPVLEALRDCSIFHFAGHGFTDELDPSKSGLVLMGSKDNTIDYLTVSHLQELRLQKSETGPPLLAYLSACSTGRTKDISLVDEALHLLGACRISGFRHAIGSLAPVPDDICIKTARTVYDTILRGNATDRSVAEALHGALRRFRQPVDVTSNVEIMVLHPSLIGDELGQAARNATIISRPTGFRTPVFIVFMHMGV